ncbi:conserved hypothetical protein [Candidatus Desulfosporosinus infrequens]|uniref:Uncharacterized protein n=1 Tax=Candidatus Desulfosporosinus infrequens TaxID=2043169 RepID=A0A2U3LNY2_9FIRM|nr:conserved hypothetical protein [Candidatus Desulfosporosinus infrequens]
MNYEKIAEMVHSLVKNPNDLTSYEQRISSVKILPREFSIIQKVFSKYELSGDAVTIRVIPDGTWA